ncbi:MAG TPA: fumarylacetoacetate hydrolase family protein [Devosiaceae bacterium]
MVNLDAGRVEDLAQKLAAVHKAGGALVPSSEIADISLDEAMAIQQRVLTLLDESVPVVKIGLNPEGEAIAAPIPGSLVSNSGEAWTVPPYGIIGLEAEVAVRLKADVTPEVAARGEAAVAAAVGEFVVGIELIGSRLTDRKAAGKYGPLADAVNTDGYVVGGDIDLPNGQVDGMQVEVLVNGRSVFSEPAKHLFGGPIAIVTRYARNPNHKFEGLKAGQVLTTGSLCGVLPVTRGDALEVRIGNAAPVRVTLG